MFKWGNIRWQGIRDALIGSTFHRRYVVSVCDFYGGFAESFWFMRNARKHYDARCATAREDGIWIIDLTDLFLADRERFGDSFRGSLPKLVARYENKDYVQPELIRRTLQ